MTTFRPLLKWWLALAAAALLARGAAGGFGEMGFRPGPGVVRAAPRS
jgi:hypothetical protein